MAITKHTPGTPPSPLLLEAIIKSIPSLTKSISYNPNEATASTMNIGFLFSLSMKSISFNIPEVLSLCTIPIWVIVGSLLNKFMIS